jgi:class 3 adenylate cyclase/tetratricopeptide (TPR) repeat protein
MFTDVEGSTALREERGDWIADDMLAIHELVAREHIDASGGHGTQFLGDGFLTIFDSPEKAVACAVAIQHAMDRHNEAHPDRKVRVRIGLHHGEVTERDGNLYGLAVHAAARVVAQAAGRQILLSETVRDLIADEFTGEIADLGLFWLKGFPERWRLYELRWTGEPGNRRPLLGLPARSPFVEHDHERAGLRSAVEGALAGNGGFVLVCGEAGVGKSRIVQEVGTEAEARGMRVLTGHCVEMKGGAPYLPYVEIVEQALTDPRSPQALREALGDAAPEIARIAPVLRRAFPDIAPPVDLPPELARRYLWNSVHEFIENAARAQPLLLILEDLHWADESTVLLTEYLAPLLPRMPVLMIGTYRDVEVELSEPLSRTIHQLMRRRAIQRITLKRLSRRGVGAMLEGLAGERPPEEVIAAIYSETEGNPFFVEELFLHLAESGVLFDESGRLRADVHIDEVNVPESVRLVVGQRLEKLSAPAQRVLVAAAVLGRVFEPDLAGAVAGLQDNDLLDALEEAEEARLVAPVEGDGRLNFSHEQIRQTLLADTSTMRRERLHLRAAQAIEDRFAPDIERHAADVAHHLERSGHAADNKKLVRYLRIAGRRALEAAAFEDAIDHLEHALSISSEGDKESRAGLLEDRAMALRGLGRWEDALVSMNEALDLYESLGRTQALGRLAWAMVYQLTWAARLTEAVEVAQRALRVLGDAPDPDAARLTSAAAWAVSLSGNYQTSTEMFGQARSLAQHLGEDRALADVLHMETVHHLSFAEFDQGIQAGLEAARVFEAKGALWDLCSVLAFVIFQDGTLGRQEQVSALGQQTMAAAERLGHLGAIFLLLADRTRQEVMRGDIAAVEALAAEMVEVSERGGLPWRYVGHLYLGLTGHWHGDARRAETGLRRAMEFEPAAAFSGQSASLLALELAHEGRSDEVKELHRGAQEAFPAPGKANTLGAWNTLLGFTEALYLSGMAHEAAAHYPLIMEALSKGEEWITFDCRLLNTRAGIAAGAGRLWDAAEHHYRVAMAVARRMSNHMEEADVRRLYAKMLLDRTAPGDRERARDLIDAVVEDYRRMGMPRHVELSYRMLEHA